MLQGHYYSFIRDAANTPNECMGNSMLSVSADSDCVTKAKRLGTHKSFLLVSAL